MKETGAQASVSQTRRGQYSDGYATQAYKLCLLGATDRELGSFFKVSATTIGRWRKAHPDFGDAIARGKHAADMEVAESLYRATLDRVVTTKQAIKCKEVYYDDNGKRVEKERIEVVEVEKHLPACFRSQQFWLRSRNPRLWNAKYDEADDNPTRAVTINLGPGHDPDGDEAPC
ncbi:hypothetical protein [Flavobacterium sp.]|uniref:hypothetical protein n=1 Tax=Flavobacterium sp. TaxID=239 RepID=UPI0040342B79